MKITEQLSSGEQIEALDLAIRTLDGGEAAIDDAITAVAADRASTP